MLIRQQGVSLIEVMIAIAIIAILMVFGLPNYTQWVQNTQIRNAAESVVNGLQLARAESLRRNAYVNFGFTNAASSDWRICVWDRTGGVCDATAEVIQEYKASEGSRNARLGVSSSDAAALTVALASGAGIPGGVTFSGFGRPSAPGTDLVRIDVMNPLLSVADQRRLVVRVSIGGQVRMCDPKLPLASSPQGCV